MPFPTKWGASLCFVNVLATAPLQIGDAGGATRVPGQWLSKGCLGVRDLDDDLAAQFSHARSEGTGWIDINVEEEDLGVTGRSFFAYIPRDVGVVGVPSPLVLLLHGQSGTADKHALNHRMGTLGEALKFITVFPQGLDDAPADQKDQGTGWNVGSAGDATVCAPAVVQQSNASTCYQSCQLLQLCGPCNWSTCHDDVLFIQQVIEAVARNNCVDMSRVYLQGESNGGMLAHHLLQQSPGVFAAASPWFGLPLKGYGELSAPGQVSAMRATAILSAHGRQDRTIPLTGGMADGWDYESLVSEQSKWAAIHGCQSTPQPISTRWDGGDANLECLEYRGCTSGRSVMTCLYDGEHGDHPPDLDDLVIWFFLKFRLDQPDLLKSVSHASRPGSLWTLLGPILVLIVTNFAL